MEVLSNYHGQTPHHNSPVAFGSKQEFDHDNVTSFLRYKFNITQIFML